ncbi:hypothetical protein BJ742DRAFT_329061 [Cladochytrium replicatum]|nr:hypothetical protein BJ742DRAFT_329061 [Cladochytrium replicatum]
MSDLKDKLYLVNQNNENLNAQLNLFETKKEIELEELNSELRDANKVLSELQSDYSELLRNSDDMEEELHKLRQDSAKTNQCLTETKQHLEYLKIENKSTDQQLKEKLKEVHLLEQIISDLENTISGNQLTKCFENVESEILQITTSLEREKELLVQKGLEIENLQSRNAELEALLHKTQDSVINHQSALSEKEKSFNALYKEKHNLEQTLTVLETEVSKLTQREQELGTCQSCVLKDSQLNKAQDLNKVQSEHIEEIKAKLLLYEKEMTDHQNIYSSDKLKWSQTTIDYENKLEKYIELECAKETLKEMVT